MTILTRAVLGVVVLAFVLITTMSYGVLAILTLVLGLLHFFPSGHTSVIGEV